MHAVLKGIQLSITYLFMNADGVCREEELKNYKEVCDGMEASDSMKNGIDEYAKTLPLSDGDNSEIIIDAIGKILGFSQYKNERPHTCDVNVDAAVSGSFAYMINNDKVCQARLVWTLINMGYADREYSKPEQKIVDHLVKAWDIDKVLFAEMIDTADTALAIVRQRQWLKNTNGGADSMDISDIEKLYKNIGISIENADL